MFMNNVILSTDLSTGIPQRRSIFAIFVHFGPQKVTDVAIASLQAGTLSPDHIIVVDHTFSGSNTGYAAGLVEGLKQAALLGAKETDLCLLLNNDITFDQQYLQYISTWWEKNGGPKVLAGVAGGYVSLFSGRAHISPHIKKATPWHILYIHGSCIVGEFGLLSSGIFPTSFFMYWEDVAVSMFVQKIPCTLAVIPGIHGIHDDKLNQVSDAKLFYMVRNGAYVLERYTGPMWKIYWYGINTLRRTFHQSIRNSRHAIIARALAHARSQKLGKADI